MPYTCCLHSGEQGDLISPWPVKKKIDGEIGVYQICKCNLCYHSVKNQFYGEADLFKIESKHFVQICNKINVYLIYVVVYMYNLLTLEQSSMHLKKFLVFKWQAALFEYNLSKVKQTQLFNKSFVQY